MDDELPGQPLSLTCTAVVSENITGSLVLTWQDSEGMLLQSRSDISISEEMAGDSYQRTLHFNPLRHSHSGEYMCVVEIADIAFTRAVTHTLTVPSKRTPFALPGTFTSLCKLLAIGVYATVHPVVRYSKNIVGYYSLYKSAVMLSIS